MRENRILRPVRPLEEDPSGQRTQGLTLLEVVVSMSLMALIALSMVAVLGTCLRANAANRDRELVRLSIRNEMEEVLAWPNYDTIKANFDGQTFTVGQLEPTFGSVNPGQVTVDDTNPLLLRVTVQVNWIAPYGQDNMELSTLISRPTGTVPLPTN